MLGFQPKLIVIEKEKHGAKEQDRNSFHNSYPLNKLNFSLYDIYIDDSIGKKFHLFALYDHFLILIRLKGPTAYAKLHRFAPLWDTSFSAAIFDRRLLVSWGKLWYNHRTNSMDGG